MPTGPNPRSSVAKRSWGGGEFEFAIPASSLISRTPFRIEALPQHCSATFEIQFLNIHYRGGAVGRWCC